VAPVQQLGINSDSAADNVSVRQPNWRRDDGFLIAELTFNNNNGFAVYEVIVTCEFFDSRGLHIGNRGSLIMRVLPPGRTTIDGIEFTTLRGKALDRDMRGGACAVASATRLGPPDISASR
jgi:hypothetical protein